MESMEGVFSKRAYRKSMPHSDKKQDSLQNGFLSQGERDSRDYLRFLTRVLCGYCICPTCDYTLGWKPQRALTTGGGGGSSADTCRGCGLSEKGPKHIRLLHSSQNSWIFRRGEKMGEPNVKRGQDWTGFSFLPSDK